MKAVVLRRFGPPEGLVIEDVPSPSCGPGMVRIRVRAIGLNFADVFGRMGLYPGIPNPPFIPGIEFSGDVAEVATGVRGIRKGDRVGGFTKQGAYAEEICVPSHYVAKLPRRMSYQDGASFFVTFLSAWHGLRTLAQVKSGESILVHSAAGGVGTACLQLGAHWGCTMIGTVSQTAKREVALAQGATEVVSYGKGEMERAVRERTSDRGVDIVMDAVGGMIMRRSWKLLAPMGRYVLYGFAAAASRRRMNWIKLVKEYVSFPLIMPPTLPSRNVSLMGFNLYFVAEQQEYLRSVVKDLLSLYQRRIIRPFIGRTFSFDQVSAAHSFLQSRDSVGKVVLTLS